MALSKEQEESFINALVNALDSPESSEDIWPECDECGEGVPGTTFNAQYEMDLCQDCKDTLDITWG